MAVGQERIDLTRAMELLGRDFGVQRLAIIGGGHTCGAFLAAGLLDEVSVMVAPGIDGRKGMAAVFDGIDQPDHPATRLRLTACKPLACGAVWLRYVCCQEKNVG